MVTEREVRIRQPDCEVPTAIKLGKAFVVGEGNRVYQSTGSSSNKQIRRAVKNEKVEYRTNTAKIRTSSNKGRGETLLNKKTKPVSIVEKTRQLLTTSNERRTGRGRPPGTGAKG